MHSMCRARHGTYLVFMTDAESLQLLLRIEKYPHRINFSKGILESRRLHYKHLSKLLVS